MAADFEAPAGLGTAVIGVPEGNPVHLAALLESVLEGVLVTGTVRAVAQGDCVRCLDRVELPLEATFQELFVYPERAEAARADGSETDEERPEVVDDVLDIAPAVRDAVVLGLPFGPLCRDDCPGLCAECGVKLVEDPDHAHRAVDPRWAALEDLLEDERKEK
jgi:uncharacterized protein